MAEGTAFVTGGSGFIGGRLLRRLTGDGWTVRALARSERSAAAVAEAGAEPVRGDLDEVEAMRAGAEGCDVAFHAAAFVGEWGKRSEFEQGNVVGTKNALEACRSAGVRRFVHVGTEAALLAGQPLVNVDETAPLRPDSPALVLVHQGAGRADRARRVRGGVRDGRGSTAVRVGRGRHDGASGARRGHQEGSLLVDRRRPPPNLDYARGQRRSRAPAGRRARPRRRGLLRHRRRAGGVPRVHHRPAGHPGRRDTRQERGAGGCARAGRRQRGGLAPAAAAGRAADHPLRLLGVVAGVHDRHLGRAPSWATSRSSRSPRG